MLCGWCGVFLVRGVLTVAPFSLPAHLTVTSEHNLAQLLSAQSSKGSSLPTVDENLVTTKSFRVLKPVQGPESWDAGRRYLIAPAALSVCPLHVMSSLSGKSSQFLQDYTETAFGTVELGTAVVKYVGNKLAANWSTCKFLLKQNYLMEYDVNASVTASPRGFAHLQYSLCYPHPDFPDSLELEFYASPCARSDKRVVSVLKRTCLTDAVLCWSSRLTLLLLILAAIHETGES